MRDAELARQFAKAVELLDRCGVVWGERLQAMKDAQHGWPASPNLDPTTTRGGEHWCWPHQRSTDACRAAGVSCDGEVVSAGVSDPTGEAATRRDRAYDDRELLERSVRALAVEADRISGILARYGRRHATERERRETLAAGERSTAAFECWSCARVRDNHGNAWFQPAARKVTLGDGEARLLCEWCRAWLRDVGALPTVGQVDDHRRGVRVRRPKQAS